MNIQLLYMHPKNVLQNILQLNKQKLPVYNYVFKNNSCFCTVVLELNNRILKIKSLSESSKKKASKSAALIAINYIKSINYCNDETSHTIYKEINEIVLIDLENVGYKYINKNAKVVGFISKQSLYNKVDTIKKYMDIELYDGKDKNGADSLMLFYIGKNIDTYLKNKYKVIIISNDSFAKCAINILTNLGIYCELKRSI